MEAYLDILFWVGVCASCIVLVMYLLSIIGLGDLDVDAEGDSGGLGAVKSILVFIGVGTLVTRAFFISQSYSAVWSVAFGVISALVVIFILSTLMKFLMSREEEGNWYMSETVGKRGTTYVPISSDAPGRVTIHIRGADRELEARTKDQQTLSTGSEVLVLDYEKDFVWVSELPSTQQ